VLVLFGLSHLLSDIREYGVKTTSPWLGPTSIAELKVKQHIISRCGKNKHLTFFHILAFSLQIVLMISAFYWFFIALTLFLLIALEINIDHYRWYKYVVHIIGLGAPVAFAVIMFAASAYEGGGG